MTLYELKPHFREFLRPLARRLARAGVTANQVTVGTAVCSVGLGAAIAVHAEIRGLFLLIPFWLGLRMALNAIDGILAQEHQQKTRLGAYLNELGDVLSDAALYAPFALVWPFSALSVGAVIVLSSVSELAGALGPMVGGERRYDGPMGKSDRALVFGWLGLWVGAVPALPSFAAWILPTVAVLIGVTVMNRVRAGLRTAEASALRPVVSTNGHR